MLQYVGFNQTFRMFLDIFDFSRCYNCYVRNIICLFNVTNNNIVMLDNTATYYLTVEQLAKVWYSPGGLYKRAWDTRRNKARCVYHNRPHHHHEHNVKYDKISSQSIIRIFFAHHDNFYSVNSKRVAIFI